MLQIAAETTEELAEKTREGNNRKPVEAGKKESKRTKKAEVKTARFGWLLVPHTIAKYFVVPAMEWISTKS